MELVSAILHNDKSVGWHCIIRNELIFMHNLKPNTSLYNGTGK